MNDCFLFSNNSIDINIVCIYYILCIYLMSDQHGNWLESFKHIHSKFTFQNTILAVYWFEAGKQTSVAADFAIWRCASPFAFPWADITLEFTFVSMPTSSTVTVSTVTLAMAWKQIRMHRQQLISSTVGGMDQHKIIKRLYKINKGWQIFFCWPNYLKCFTNTNLRRSLFVLFYKSLSCLRKLKNQDELCISLKGLIRKPN